MFILFGTCVNMENPQAADKYLHVSLLDFCTPFPIITWQVEIQDTFKDIHTYKQVQVSSETFHIPNFRY